MENRSKGCLLAFVFGVPFIGGLISLFHGSDDLLNVGAVLYVSIMAIIFLVDRFRR